MGLGFGSPGQLRMANDVAGMDVKLHPPGLNPQVPLEPDYPAANDKISQLETTAAEQQRALPPINPRWSQHSSRLGS